MMRWALICLTAGLLAGCNGSGAVDTTIVLKQIYPPECLEKPADWQKLPPGPARKKTVARNYRENKERFRTNAANQRTCAAGLGAST